jgi:hypothetical protein
LGAELGHGIWYIVSPKQVALYHWLPPATCIEVSGKQDGQHCSITILCLHLQLKDDSDPQWVKDALLSMGCGAPSTGEPCPTFVSAVAAAVAAPIITVREVRPYSVQPCRYPQKGSLDGQAIPAAVAVAKSYASCMIGKVTKATSA